VTLEVPHFPAKALRQPLLVRIDMGGSYRRADADKLESQPNSFCFEGRRVEPLIGRPGLRVSVVLVGMQGMAGRYLFIALVHRSRVAPQGATLRQIMQPRWGARRKAFRPSPG
jgi:hypothetical protein